MNRGTPRVECSSLFLLRHKFPRFLPSDDPFPPTSRRNLSREARCRNSRDISRQPAPSPPRYTSPLPPTKRPAPDVAGAAPPGRAAVAIPQQQFWRPVAQRGKKPAVALGGRGAPVAERDAAAAVENIAGFEVAAGERGRNGTCGGDDGIEGRRGLRGFRGECTSFPTRSEGEGKRRRGRGERD